VSEVVALGGEGKPSFNILQNFGSGKAPLDFYVFDLLILAGKDVMTMMTELRGWILALTDELSLTDPQRSPKSGQ
jgi:hypothetical protein